MGVRFPSVASTTLQNALPANANETVVLTTPPLTISLDFAQIIIQWYVCLLAGTGTTSLGIKLRRGTTITGTLLTSVNSGLTLAAGATGILSGVFVDTPGAVAAQQYTVTLNQVGATVAGTMNDQCILAFAL